MVLSFRRKDVCKIHKMAGCVFKELMLEKTKLVGSRQASVIEKRDRKKQLHLSIGGTLICLFFRGVSYTIFLFIVRFCPHVASPHSRGRHATTVDIYHTYIKANALWLLFPSQAPSLFITSLLSPSPITTPKKHNPPPHQNLPPNPNLRSKPGNPTA